MANNAQRPRPPPNRRRDKVQLSCDACRLGKLRCDRQHPCGACSRRGLANSCNYTTTTPSAPDARRPVAPQQTASLHGRITELENLVATVIGSPSLPSPPTTESSGSNNKPAFSTDPGTLKLRESGASYVQSVHWEAILNKIRGLKEDLVAEGKATPGSHLFYGPSRHATRDEIIAAVPPRAVVDRLMALHFDSYIITPYFIHSKKFLREYEGFWEDPSATSISWIGLMFSMLYIAAQLQIFTVDFTDERAELVKEQYLITKDAFRERAVQCLVLAKYTRGGPFILETLITVLTGEFILSKDGVSDGSLSIGLILHLAVRMGYHRDPDHFPGIPPFESEMRKRVWATILQLDLVLSLEMGLPRSATDTHIDTGQPSNLRDCDFDEDTAKLPLPRPETEWTPILPLIARGRLLRVLGLICNINTEINLPSYEELIKIDARLEDLYNYAIPPLLRWKTMPHTITDSPQLVVQRVSIETTYHKARILLYRRALISYPSRPPQERNRESMRVCLNSALRILSFQQMLHEESQPFGRLCQLRWKVRRIFDQDVLLATSVLCLYLQDIDTFELSETSGRPVWPSRAEEVRQRLAISHKIWLQMSTASAEAAKVAKALSTVLENTKTSVEDCLEFTPYDFLTSFDTAPLDGFGTRFSSPYFPSGFYSPLTFFDSVLETQKI